MGLNVGTVTNPPGGRDGGGGGGDDGGGKLLAASAMPVAIGPIPANSPAAPKIRRIENLVMTNTWSPLQ